MKQPTISVVDDPPKVRPFDPSNPMKTPRTLLLLSAPALLLVLYLLLTLRHGGELGGVVLDADTGRPLEGVILVRASYPEGRGDDGPVAVDEAVSGAAGTFSFPAWWKLVPLSLALGSSSGMRSELQAFKPGFDLGGLEAPDPADNRFTIGLQKFSGPAEEYSKRLTRVEMELHAALTSGSLRCAGRNAPEMLKALGKQDRQFEAAGIGHLGLQYFFAADAAVPALAAQHCDDVLQLVSGNAA